MGPHDATPLRVFLYEHLCATPGDLVPSLRAEGWAMLRAALADFAAVPGVRVVTAVRADLAPTAREVAPAATIHALDPAGRATATDEGDFKTWAAGCEFALVIAPEFDGLLQTRSRWAAEAGARLLGPSPAAVAETADKLWTAHRLQAAGVLTPPTSPFRPDRVPFHFPAVVKPRFGAGSQATFRVDSWREYLACPQRAREEGWAGPLIVQPLEFGQAVSQTVLAGPGGVLLPPPSTQLLTEDGRFRYLGGQVPARGPGGRNIDRRAALLARRVIEVFPGLSGWFGVDLLLEENDQVIEINPRVTTSYVGLRALAHFNLAGALLDLARGRHPEDVAWDDRPLCYSADGSIQETS